MLPFKEEDEIKYMNEHPPTCISELHAPAPDDVRKLILEEYGENTTVFGTKCPCGSTEFQVQYTDQGGVVTITCSQCEKEYVVFDPYRDGYNGKLDVYEEEEFKEDPVAFDCAECNHTTVKVFTAYQYNGESGILEEEEEEIPEDVKPEDLFNFFMLVTECAGCGDLEVAFEEDCV